MFRKKEGPQKEYKNLEELFDVDLENEAPIYKGRLDEFDYIDTLGKVLLKIPPAELAILCSTSKNRYVVEVCGSDSFIERYEEIHKKEILFRRQQEKGKFKAFKRIDPAEIYVGDKKKSFNDLKRAIYEGDIQTYKNLIEIVPLDYLTVNWGLKTVSHNGHTEMVKSLLANPLVDPSADENQALRLAVENGHIETVKILTDDYRVHPDRKMIITASEKGFTEIVRILLDKQPLLEQFLRKKV